MIAAVEQVQAKIKWLCQTYVREKDAVHNKSTSTIKAIIVSWAIKKSHMTTHTAAWEIFRFLPAEPVYTEIPFLVWTRVQTHHPQILLLSIMEHCESGFIDLQFRLGCNDCSVCGFCFLPLGFNFFRQPKWIRVHISSSPGRSIESPIGLLMA